LRHHKTLDTSTANGLISNPKLLGRKISQFYNRTKTNVDYNPSGIDIFEQEWNNLLLLDACRYDLFENIHDFEGELQSVTSRGDATPEFLRGNFQDRVLHDTVYVTANPMLHGHKEEINVSFHDVINLWTGDSWDEEHGTVLPEVVTAEAKRANEQYPNKRLLVHYMQPHYPFINSKTTFDQGHIGAGAPDELTTWMQVTTGEIDIEREELWKSYEENLRQVLPHIHHLMETLPGKVILTSDHGNIFGERASPIPIREWGHPPNLWTEELIKVPWLEVSCSKRKEINSEDPNIQEGNLETDIKDRLQKLGYV
jgi:hypothetical protein